MSSVLKRLRETAEMRELKVKDRGDYRFMKYLASEDGLARKYVEVRTPSEKEIAALRDDDPNKEKKQAARERSKQALAELHKNSRLKGVVGALRTFLGRV